MKLSQLKQKISDGALSAYAHLYHDIERQSARMTEALDHFAALYGEDRDVALFSVPGRSEITGNHTDHNLGCVLAGAIDRDIIAVASRNEDGMIRFQSEGYPENKIDLSLVDSPENFRPFTSTALVAGMARGFALADYSIGGFDAYSTTEVLKGSGISSSAAFEVMVGNILNHFYNDGAVDNAEIAKIAQYSENVFFGKPCGLMDQMACAVGGFVFIDFADPKNPVVEPIDFSLTGAGYSLCIINTGGNHANLNEDYASVPGEMKAVAALLGGEVLRPYTETDILAHAKEIRESLGDRALLRALHFVRENARVLRAASALREGDVDTFLAMESASGNSSFKYLQNIYTVKNVKEQGLSLALCLAEKWLDELSGGACRVHGGGFAGTIQVFIRREHAAEFVAKMDAVFGEGASMCLSIRPLGAVKLF
ncbi:MAG: galactokinase [Clostridia bacterium]|nr:galactokinase [Clostridia bacterium]